MHNGFVASAWQGADVAGGTPVCRADLQALIQQDVAGTDLRLSLLVGLFQSRALWVIECMLHPLPEVENVLRTDRQTGCAVAWPNVDNT